MEDCCTLPTAPRRTEALSCPQCGLRGKPVDVITLKSLLTPAARATLGPKATHFFCRDPSCAVVYFAESRVYRTQDVTVPVFQKNPSAEVPVCYCFGWTRARIRAEIERTGRSTAAETISAHVQADRCACEVMNPQGSCCLGNILGVVKTAVAPLPV
jgi:CopZ-like zinc binding protein